MPDMQLIEMTGFIRSFLYSDKVVVKKSDMAEERRGWV
jgi:hypothetical protein